MRPLRNTCEVTVIGGGIAGLSAARQAARLGRSVTLFEGSGIYGGQVGSVGDIDGLPLPGIFSGQDVAIHLLEEIRKARVRIVEAGVEDVQLGERLELVDEGNSSWFPEVIIVASGASLRALEVPGEAELIGRGVSQCATCDGGFFRDEHVVVVGGGDSAVQEALELTKICRLVTMVCRSPLKATREYIDRIAAKENVSFVWDSEVCEIYGEESVQGIRLRNVKDDSESDMPCTAVFPFVGVSPNTGFLPPALLCDGEYVETNRRLATIDPRLFAAGAVRAGFGGTLVEAMGEGVSAAAAAASSLQPS